jgi:hypothetical protein
MEIGGFCVSRKTVTSKRLVMNHVMIPDDIATWTYIWGFLVEGYGFLLFFWWWNKARREDAHISTVFIYIMAILLGSCIRDAVEMYAGYCRTTLDIPYEAMRDKVYEAWFWPGRMVIVKIAFTVLVIHMSVRAFWQRRRK